jgi:hypothetical protein
VPRDFTELIDAFMAAAVDPSLWDEATEAAAEANGSFGAAILRIGDAVPRPPVSASMAETVHDYIRYDWRGRDGLDAMRAKILRDGIATIPEDVENTDFYR